MARFSGIEKYLEERAPHRFEYISEIQPSPDILVLQCDMVFSEMKVCEYPFPGFVYLSDGINRVRFNCVTNITVCKSKMLDGDTIKIFTGGAGTKLPACEHIIIAS